MFFARSILKDDSIGIHNRIFLVKHELMGSPLGL